MKLTIKILTIVLFLGITSNISLAQKTLSIDKSNSSLTVTGTSTIHDWEIITESYKGEVKGTFSKDNMSIESSELTAYVKSMKSGKGSMDDVVYEAMEEEDYPTIKFEYVKTEKITESDGKFKAVILGKLTIAGETKTLRLNVEMADMGSALKAEGSASFKMSTFGIEPPSAMFGTIKSGDLITINYKLIYK